MIEIYDLGWLLQDSHVLLLLLLFMLLIALSPVVAHKRKQRPAIAGRHFALSRASVLWQTEVVALFMAYCEYEYECVCVYLCIGVSSIIFQCVEFSFWLCVCLIAYYGANACESQLNVTSAFDQCSA